MSNTLIVDSEGHHRGPRARREHPLYLERLGCSVADINDVLDRFAHVTISANLRTHTLALELERLDKLQQSFEQQAHAGDVQSAMLVTKIIERRCIMLGLSAPPRTDHHIIEH